MGVKANSEPPERKEILTGFLPVVGATDQPREAL